MNYDDLFIDSKLPEPLTQAEIFNYFEKYKSGDTSAREIIIGRNIRLVLNQVLKRFSNAPYDKKELVSIGLIGLVKSVDTFDTSKKLQFSTYAIRCIDNEILMFMRKGKKYVNDSSLDDTLRTDKDGSELKLEDILYDEDSDFILDYEEKESHSIIRRLVAELPERDKEIIVLHFGFIDDKPLTQKEIANKLNLSQSYVSRLITKIVKRIGIQLQEQGIIETTTKIKSSKPKNKNNNKKGNEDNMGRKLQSIYDYFEKFTKKQVDEMLAKLTDEERNLITLRYGNDLEHPTTSPEWNKEHQTKFYYGLIPKMKRLLENPEHKRKPRTVKPKTEKNKDVVVPTVVEEIQPKQPVVITENKEDISATDEMTLEDYTRILELFRAPSFSQLMTVLSAKEAVIVSLKLGYIDGKYFSTESISNFLGIEQDEVRESTKKFLLACKENINQSIDNAIQYTTDQPVILKKHK